jgi:hypothetical protein
MPNTCYFSNKKTSKTQLNNPKATYPWDNLLKGAAAIDQKTR